MILNLHERWLLLTVGVRRRERHELLRALQETGQTGGDVDLLAELGGYTMAKRSVKKDLPALFDELLSPHGPSVHGVAYGDRRYRKPVILAAALHRAGISAVTYRAGIRAGYRRLQQFRALSDPGENAESSDR